MRSVMKLQIELFYRAELRLPDRDFVGEVVAFFARYRAEYAIFGVAGVDVDGEMLDFHQAEVRAREQMRRNAQKSILVTTSNRAMAPRSVAIYLRWT